MSDPATWALVIGAASVAMGAAGTGVAVHSARQQSKAAEDAADFNAQQAANNAKAAQDSANFEADQVKRKNLLLLGKQRAIAAKSGVLISGSVADVIEDSSVQGELDVMASMYRGAVQSSQQTSQSNLYDAQAKNISSGRPALVAGTLLSGLGQTTSTAAQFPGFRK